MGRSKLARFQANAESNNIIEEGKPLYETIKGNWHTFFQNQHPIVLEVGCGRGEYTTGLANIFPNKNFIGVDIKGSRLWKGSKVATDSGFGNAAFLRTKIQNLEQFFTTAEVSEIWITFPDPRPKDKEERLRLTSPRYLQLYKSILSAEGIVNFKTDNLALFEYTLDLLKSGELQVHNLEYTFDLYNSDLIQYHYNIQTTFEKKFLDQQVPINYLRFNF